MMIKGAMQQEGINLVNLYASQRGAAKYIKDILMGIQGEINSNTAIAEDFNTPLTSVNRCSTQKISKETLA